MKRKIRQVIRRGLQVLIWFFILYMGLNIIMRGTQILYGKSIADIVKDSARNVTKQIGITFMNKTDVVFSYLYKEKEAENPATIVLKKTYLLREGIKDDIIYSDEDNLYESLLEDYFAEKKYENNNVLEAPIPVISVIPDYYDGNKDEIGEGQVTEVIAPIVKPFAPAVIGKQYALSQLMNFDFLLKNFYAVEPNTTVNKKILDISEMITADMTILNEDVKYPQILIFHTHSQEAYADSRPGVTEDTVVGMGTYLAEILKRDYGYNVIHITTTFDNINGKLDRSKAYDYAQIALEKILEQYPTIEVVLDIHRDGVNEDVHLVTEYNGKQTAKIMFVNGISRLGESEISYLSNPNLDGNLAFSFQLQMKGEAYFPGLMRRIIIKAYRYNLHFQPKSALIEVGAQTNTVEEARNAIELLGVMLGEVLR